MSVGTRREVESLIDDADRLHFCEHRSTKALSRINKALRLAPEDTEALVLRGRILFWLDRPREAMQSFDQAIQINPKCADAYLERGRLRYALWKHYPTALRELREAIRYAGHDRWVRVRALQIQGHVLSELDREGDAVSSYRKALKINPHQADIQWALGSTLLTMGQPEKALPFLDKELRRLRAAKNPDPMDWESAIAEKAQALEALGKHRSALRVIERGLARAKGSGRKNLKILHKQIENRMPRRSRKARGDN